MCHQLAERGIDAIEISGGTFASWEKIPALAKINTSEKEAYHAQYAIQLADELDIPIITVGGLRSPKVIEHLLETSKIALFSLARPLLTEPDLANRWQSGDRQRAKCVSCNGCLQGSPGGNLCIHNFQKRNKKMSEVIVIATIVAKAGAGDTVKAELLKLVEATRKEQGCNSYLLHCEQNAPATFVFYENWASEEHLEKHLNSDHFRTCSNAIESMVEDKSVHRLTCIA